MTAVNQRHHSDDTSYEMEHNEWGLNCNSRERNGIDKRNLGRVVKGDKDWNENTVQYENTKGWKNEKQKKPGIRFSLVADPVVIPE